MKLKIKNNLLILGATLLLLVPQISLAKLTTCGGNEIDPSKTFTQSDLGNFYQKSCTLIGIFPEIARITNFLIGFAAAFAVFNLVLSGFRMVYGAGNEKAVKEARSGIEHAIEGFLLVMLAYLIVNSIYSILQVKLGISSSYNFPFNPFQ